VRTQRIEMRQRRQADVVRPSTVENEEYQILRLLGGGIRCLIQAHSPPGDRRGSRSNGEREDGYKDDD
jgi:hypothetical protein